jgi:hypothetical protein
MFEFSVPVKNTGHNQGFFSFKVGYGGTLLAGSRYGFVPPHTSQLLVKALARFSECGFWVGCAPGIDACFRKAFARSGLSRRVFVATAFRRRLNKQTTCGLFASCVVPHGLWGTPALVRRTLWLVKRAAMAIVFPDNPKTNAWGKGSALVIKTSLNQLKPVFVVTRYPPKQTRLFLVFPASLFGVVQGYWCVPHLIEPGGMCDQEF